MRSNSGRLLSHVREAIAEFKRSFMSERTRQEWQPLMLTDSASPTADAPSGALRRHEHVVEVTEIEGRRYTPISRPTNRTRIAILVESTSPSGSEREQ